MERSMTEQMNRRRVLKAIAGLPFVKALWPAAAKAAEAARPASRVRPGEPAWPSEASWEQLNREVGGRLIKVRSPLSAYVGAPFDE
jgi:hypothetical protein